MEKRADDRRRWILGSSYDAIDGEYRMISAFVFSMFQSRNFL
jgi:hypothetical protein